MARLTVDLFSDALEVATTVTVVWPQVTEHQVGVAGGRAGVGAGALGHIPSLSGFR